MSPFSLLHRTMYIWFPYKTPDLSEYYYNTGIKQESTNYDVAASELFYPLCAIIDASAC